MSSILEKINYHLADKPLINEAKGSQLLSALKYIQW